MTVWTIAAVACAVAAAAAAITGAVRVHALRTGMLDVPGERSSHTVPTPRGGGLAIAMCTLAGGAVLWWQGLLGGEVAAALLAGGALVALVGWLDDRRGLPAGLRLLSYLAAAALAVWLLDAAPGVPEWTVAANVLVVVAVTWLINVCNFMDGTDAFAGVQCMTAAMFGAWLFHAAGAHGLAWVCVLLAAAAAGFLYWNRPPARIFMGDTGSCFIGFLFGVLALAGVGAVPVAAWLILLAVFIVDATLTLLRRMATGEKWYSPHRTHAYQLLAQAGMTHRTLALWLLAVNAGVLGPLAIWSAAHPARSAAVAAGVAAVLSMLWFILQVRLRPGHCAGTAE